MSYNQQGWNSVSRSTTAPKPVVYTYDVNNIVGSTDNQDTLATISASAFFNAQADNIDTNDLVYIVASDAVGLYRFTSANGVSPVTVTAFDTVPAGSIVTADLANGAVTPAKASTATNSRILCLPISFASGAQTTHTIYFNAAVTVNTVRSFVTTALAATDSGTLTCSNNAGTAMSGGVVTIDASSVVGTEDSATPTTNNTFTSGQKMQIAAAKSTAGGVVNVFIEYTVTG
jgi:hypothetical protein